MRRLGVHVSIAGGLHLSLERAHALGCNTLQIFSHNPRGWAVKALSDEEVLQFRERRRTLGVSPVFIHTSYLINMASKDSLLRKKSIDLLVTEMDRADAIGAEYVILHTGSASGDDGKISRKRAIEAFNEVALRGRWKAGLLLENTAGERGDISSTLSDLSEVLHGIRKPFAAGVCFDTCHAFAAGYDLRNEKNVRNIVLEIDKCIGVRRIKLIHLNDSKGLAGSGIDRHEHIGLGKIGMRGLRAFINHRLFRDIPLILETPKKHEDDDPGNLAKVRKMIKLQ